MLGGADSAASTFVWLRNRLRDYVTLTKPRIMVMVLITAYIGFAFAVTGQAWDAAMWWTFSGMLLGTGLTCMGSAVLNQVYERETDALMHRTRKRPLPSQRVTIAEGIVLGLLLLGGGFAALILWTTWAAVWACAFTVATYALIYTPMKRWHWTSTHWGAIPGAMPPVIGYAAGAGMIGKEAWVLFAMMVIWQVPHFLAICWLYRDDYARAGLPMLPVIDTPTGQRTFPQVFWGCVLLLPVGLLPTFLGFSGWFYFAAALICGGVFLYYGVRLVQRKQRGDARALFFASLVYLPVVLIMMLVDGKAG